MARSSTILPLFVACLVGDWAGALVCRERLDHALAHDFMAKKEPDAPIQEAPVASAG